MAEAAGADDPEKGEEKGEGEEKQQLQFNPKLDLWANISQATKETQLETQDINILVIGSKGSGKSTLIQRFLKKDDSSQPRPTTALEYTHGKKEEGKKVQIVHFWEIGGGQELHSLIDVVITPENIHTVSVVVVCDLSDPMTLWDNLVGSIRRVSRRVDEVFSKHRAKQHKTPDRMLERQKKKLLDGLKGRAEADLERMRLLGMSVVIVGSKFDVFEDNPQIQTTAKTMRWLSHLHGAHLIWLSAKDDKRWLSLMMHVAFGSSVQEKYLNSEYDKGPLYVLAGRDSFDAIGKPDLVQRTPEGWVSCGDEQLDEWKKPFDDAFPPRKTQKEAEQSFEQAMLEEFAEPEIDAVRRQKDAELDNQRKEARKAQKGSHG
eukprot:TRINITY_DN16337_c0_g1_i1.p1 TRINITY_DN16337_c0_g1~~TRINITY_DN16337_c0_g1_i1.p1  ORF type:complete len:400 (+),score=176.49 TRINITY_DN16337_c0_g1_i1:77-1201(+)